MALRMSFSVLLNISLSSALDMASNMRLSTALSMFLSSQARFLARRCPPPPLPLFPFQAPPSSLPLSKKKYPTKIPYEIYPTKLENTSFRYPKGIPPRKYSDEVPDEGTRRRYPMKIPNKDACKKTLYTI